MRPFANPFRHAHAGLPRAESEYAAARGAQYFDRDIILFSAQLSQRLADRLIDSRGGGFD
jgi:hypothetical protein